MSTQSIRIPFKAWYGDETMELTFPESREVNECRMACHDEPVLSDDQLRKAIKHPLGTALLRELAKGKKIDKENMR